MRVSNQLLKRFRLCLRREDGGALAELAILVPFLVIMLAAVSELGRFFQQYTTLAKATRTASRYLSNHKLDATEVGRAQSLVVCGKLACGGSDRSLLPGLTAGNVCIESVGSPKVTSVTVKIPRNGADCTPMIQRETGGNLSELLEKVAYTIRERFRIMEDLKTMTLSSRWSAWLLCALPIFLAVYVTFMNPGYMDVMWKDPRGNKLLAIAAIMQVLGMLMVQRIMKIRI